VAEVTTEVVKKDGDWVMIRMVKAGDLEGYREKEYQVVEYML
jgi:hypothetical protein